MTAYCEAQGKGRARGRPRKVTQRSFIDGGYLKATVVHIRVTLGHLRVTIGHFRSL